MKIAQLLGHKRASKLVLAQEEFGKLTIERELCFYVKLTDLNVLNDLECILQEQWKLNLGDDETRFRARLENDKVHSICCKRDTGREDGGLLEIETQVTADYYTSQVKWFGHHGYKKKRYIYPVPGSNLKFEIDVFLSESGRDHPWVKVDLEFDGEVNDLPTFPFEVDEDCTIVANEQMTPDEEKFVEDLWENQWSRLDSAKGSLDPYYNQVK